MHFGVLERGLRAVFQMRPTLSLKIENSYMPTFRRSKNEQSDLLVRGVEGSHTDRQQCYREPCRNEVFGEAVHSNAVAG